MRPCQNCSTPIPTKAKECEKCGAQQLPTVGGESARHFPELAKVEQELRDVDQQIKKLTLWSLVGGAILISTVAGVSVGSMVLAISTFFVALLLLFVLFQVAGFDVSI